MKKRIEILDSLRGLAAVCVCIHHIIKMKGDDVLKAFGGGVFSILNFISNYNFEAVLFFFVLSGFSIGLSLKNKELAEKNEFNNYFYRRFKRILPVYWIAIVFTLVVGIIILQISLPDYSIRNLIGNLLFVQTINSPMNWAIPYGQNGPFWSLAYEIFFYCLFPFVYLLNRKFLKGVNIIPKIIFLIITSVACVAVNKFLIVRHVFVPYLGFLSLFVIWLLGYLCSFTFSKTRVYHSLFSVLTLLAVTYFAVYKRFTYLHILMVLAEGIIINAAFYFFTVFNDNTIIIKIFNPVQQVLNFLFYRIGKGSYALYALHWPVLLLFIYFKVPIGFYFIGIYLLTFLCTYLEEKSVRFKMLFLNFDYTNLIPFKKQLGLIFNKQVQSTHG